MKIGKSLQKRKYILDINPQGTGMVSRHFIFHKNVLNTHVSMQNLVLGNVNTEPWEMGAWPLWI